MMPEAAPITTQPVKSDREQDEESKTERQAKRKTCWQRFSAPFRKCYGNMIDCLDFWCCRNECYDFCCNYNDVDEDEREVAYIRDVEVVDDQVALTDMSSLNTQAHSGDVEISETKLHSDHHLGDQTSGHHNTRNVSKLHNDINQGDEREVAYISDVEVVYDQAALIGSLISKAHSGDAGISETKLHGDNHLGDKLNGQHHTGNVNHGGDHSGGHHHRGDHHGRHHSGGHNHGGDHHGGHHSGEHNYGGDHHGEHHSGGHIHGGDHHGGHHSGGHHHGGDYSGGGDSGGGDCGGGDSAGGDCGGGGGD